MLFHPIPRHSEKNAIKDAVLEAYVVLHAWLINHHLSLLSFIGSSRYMKQQDYMRGLRG